MRRAARTACVVLAAALAPTATVLLTPGPAVAATVTTTIEEVRVRLTDAEEVFAVDPVVGAPAVCQIAVLPQLEDYLTIPLTLRECADGIQLCGMYAFVHRWSSFVTVFTRTSVTCLRT